MNFPCAVPPQNCPGVDSPLIGNASAETPDRPRSFGYKFFQDDSTFCTSEDPAIAALCNPPPPSNPPVLIVYTSNPQTCTKDCSDGTSQTYTAIAGSGVSIVSQTDADVQALNLACAVAAILCAGGIPTLYSNVPQICTVPCALGGSFSYTVVAGTFYSLNSQNEANLLAFQFACVIAASLCPLPPPTGNGPPPPAPPANPYFGNSPQSCTTNCTDGGEFIYTVPAGMFTAESKAAANAIAHSYACQQAAGASACLGPIASEACASEDYLQVITLTMAGTITWSVIAGTLPPGLHLMSGMISGIPIMGGAYVFTVRAANNLGQSATRTYSISVVQITTTSLPDGDTSTPYAQALSVIGAGASPTWGVIGGALPDGLTLQPFTGVISGTPTVADDFSFTIGVQPQGSDLICGQDYEIEVTGGVDCMGEAQSIQAAVWTYAPAAGTIVITNGDGVFSDGGAAFSGEFWVDANAVICNPSLNPYTVSVDIDWTVDGFLILDTEALVEINGVGYISPLYHSNGSNTFHMSAPFVSGLNTIRIYVVCGGINSGVPSLNGTCTIRPLTPP